MRTVFSLVLAVGVVLLTGQMPVASAPEAWKVAKPETLNALPGPGKTLKTFAAPNGRYSLLYRDENEQGDFVWRRVYLKQGNSHTLIGSYNEIKNVRWIKGGRTVQFRAVKAIDFKQDQAHGCRIYTGHPPSALALGARRDCRFLIGERV